MNLWHDQKAVARRRLKNAFGISATYYPNAGDSFVVRGIYSKESVSEQAGQSDLRTTSPTFYVDLDDFLAEPTNKDSVEIDGITYRVVEVRPDDSGMATLQLRKS